MQTDLNVEKSANSPALYRSGFELYRSNLSNPQIRIPINVGVEIIS